MNKKNIFILKVSLFLIAIITLILCLFWLPNLAERVAKANPEYAYLKYPVLILVYITAIPFYLAFYQAYKILNSINNGETFTDKPLDSLGIIKNCALSEIVIYLILTIFLLSQNALHPGVLIPFVAIMFAASIIAVFVSVLKELLGTAIEIKSENDLTV